MDILQLIQKGVRFIQALEPGVKSAQQVGAVVGPVVVKALYLGRQLSTYLVTRRAGGEARPSTQIEVEDTAAEPLEKGMPMITKSDVALLVDINQRIFHDVSRYLDAQKIDADIVILTNDPAYSAAITPLPTDDPEVWTALAQEFSAAMSSIKHTVGSVQMHIFLATPLPLAFGLGNVWGTVNEATVYHWEAGTYHPVMRISRDLRFAKN